MSSTQTPFDQLTRIAKESGVEKTLDFMEHRFRTEQEYYKLFEVLKMRCRYRLGLPLIYSRQPDALSPQQQTQLEDALISACREVGTLLIKDGRIQEGWMYLQPVGDRELSEKLLSAVEVNEDNVDTLIEIAVSQGAAPALGYELLLKHYGTCNAITTFDTQAMRFDRSVQQAMAQRLLRHLYDELRDNLRHAIQAENKSVAEAASLAEMLHEHPWLTAGGGHHIDTTHLASAMRIARSVDHPDDLQKALELADYGSQLHQDFQYPSPPPFEDTYLDHRLFYRGLLGQGVDETLAHFRDKCESTDTEQYGPVAIETLVDFLVRCGRNTEAIEVLTGQLLGKFESMGIAPQVFDIARSDEQLQIVSDFYRDQDDLLGFAIGVLKASEDGTR